MSENGKRRSWSAVVKLRTVLAGMVPDFEVSDLKQKGIPVKRTIEISGNVFNPPGNEPSVIEVGDTVVWHNQDGVAHNAISLGVPAFHTPDFGPGNSVEVGPFTAATDAHGIPYFCDIHTNMNGTIIVVLPGSHHAAFARIRSAPMHGGGHGGTK